MVACVRAAVQLTVIGAVLGLVFRLPVAAAVVLLVMLTTATRTAGRRLRELDRATRAVLIASVAGALCTLVVAFATGAVAFQVRYVVALGGITLGGTMTACTLAGGSCCPGSGPGGTRSRAGWRWARRPARPSGTSPGPRPGRRCCRRSTRPARSGW